MEGLRVFSDAGWVVHLPNPEADERFNERGPSQWSMDGAEFAGRRPILANPDTRDIYVGAPNWYHYDTAGHFGVSEWDNDRGYFGGGSMWGDGNLRWYGYGEQPPEHHPDVAKALTEAGFEIPNHDGIGSVDEGDEDWQDDGLWEDAD
jgi:hypothetical protein